MKKSLLLPHRFKKIGWWLVAASILCIPTLVLLDRFAEFPWQYTKHITNGAMTVGLIALSQEKTEDEYIAALRGQTIAAIVYVVFGLAVVWAVVSGPLHLPKWLGLVGKENLFWLYILPTQLTNIWFVVGLYILLFNTRLWFMRIRTANEK